MAQPTSWRAIVRSLFDRGTMLPPPPTEVSDSIEQQRAAANRLNGVAESVRTRAELTVRQVVEQATDEAARFTP